MRHGPRLAADGAAYGDLVAAQLASAADGSVASDGPGDALRARVAAVAADDFVVDDLEFDGCLDLVLTAVRRPHAGRVGRRRMSRPAPGQ